MKWVVFSYSLPSIAKSNRVTLWRRLRRLGAISPTSGVFILPALEECIEAFQWLAQEVQQADGAGLVMHVDQFQNIDSSAMVGQFNQARQADYEDISKQVEELINGYDGTGEFLNLETYLAALARLRKQFAEVARVDYFQCPEGALVAASLRRAELLVAPPEKNHVNVKPVVLEDFREKTWVTRPRPHVDRLACAWLIRRYINPEAVIRYSSEPEGGEIAFDTTSAHFGHLGSLCTFEVMLRSFDITDPAMASLSEIVHEIDLRDGRYYRQECPGIDAVLRGWLEQDVPDLEMEARGIALFDGLFASLSHVPDPG